MLDLIHKLNALSEAEMVSEGSLSPAAEKMLKSFEFAVKSRSGPNKGRRLVKTAQTGNDGLKELLKKGRVEKVGPKTYALVEGSGSDLQQQKWAEVFDKLAAKKIKKVQMDAKSVMGGGTNGFRMFARGRMGKERRFRGGYKGSGTKVSMSLKSLDDSGKPMKTSPRAAYRLWKTTWEDGSVDISASVGDMGIMLQDLKAG